VIRSLLKIYTGAIPGETKKYSQAGENLTCEDWGRVNAFGARRFSKPKTNACFFASQRLNPALEFSSGTVLLTI